MGTLGEVFKTTVTKKNRKKSNSNVRNLVHKKKGLFFLYIYIYKDYLKIFVIRDFLKFNDFKVRLFCPLPRRRKNVSLIRRRTVIE